MEPVFWEQVALTDKKLYIGEKPLKLDWSFQVLRRRGYINLSFQF